MKKVLIAIMAVLFLASSLGAQEVTATGNEAAPAVTEEPRKETKWYDKVKLNADFRYRYEMLKNEGSDPRHRNRLRARVGFDANIIDPITMVFKLATGAGEPVSTNQTLTGGFGQKNIWIDLAYFDWHPSSLNGFSLTGGKVKMPFHKPGETELIWDGDLNPEGLALNYSHDFGMVELFGAGAGFWIQERSSDDDTFLLGFQAGSKFDFLDGKLYFKPAIGYFNYTSVEGRPYIYDVTDSAGNTAVTGVDAYLYDFNQFEFFAELGGKIMKMPVAVFGDYVKNIASNVVNDQGYLIGLKVGKCKDPWSYEFRYNFRELESDAVIGAFTDSDFRDGGTDGKGHEFGFDLQLAKHVQTGLTYFFNQKGVNAGTDFHRFQLDLIVKL